MNPQVCKTLLKADPGQAREQLEELASGLTPDEHAAGERLRAVAAEMVRRGLEVTTVDYQDGALELEVILPQARQLGPVRVNRDARGQGCQLSWEDWVDIADEAGAGHAAGVAAAVLRSIAAGGPQLSDPGPGGPENSGGKRAGTGP
jgi:hypothetical protein